MKQKMNPDEAYEIARERRLEEQAEREEAQQAEERTSQRQPHLPIRNHHIPDDNGPTGHGDICYSDADPGL